MTLNNPQTPRDDWRRALVDEQLPKRFVHWLRKRGYATAHHVLDLRLRDDAAIASHAEAERYIVFTKDADFLGLQQPARFAVVRLCYGNCSNAQLFDRLDAQWVVVERLLMAGEMLVELR